MDRASGGLKKGRAGEEQNEPESPWLIRIVTADDTRGKIRYAELVTQNLFKGLGKEAVNFAKSIEISAEIKLGEILTIMEKNKGVQGRFAGGQQGVPPVEIASTLKEIGISKNLSSEAQTLAGLSVKEHEKVKSGYDFGASYQEDILSL